MIILLFLLLLLVRCNVPTFVFIINGRNAVFAPRFRSIIVLLRPKRITRRKQTGPRTHLTGRDLDFEIEAPVPQTMNVDKPTERTLLSPCGFVLNTQQLLGIKKQVKGRDDRNIIPNIIGACY